MARLLVGRVLARQLESVHGERVPQTVSGHSPTGPPASWHCASAQSAIPGITGRLPLRSPQQCSHERERGLLTLLHPAVEEKSPPRDDYGIHPSNRISRKFPLPL